MCTTHFFPSPPIGAQAIAVSPGRRLVARPHPLQGLFVQLVKHHDLAVKGMVVFNRREVPRCGGELSSERHLRVGPNNV
jgi:hypothetical protein